MCDSNTFHQTVDYWLPVRHSNLILSVTLESPEDKAPFTFKFTNFLVVDVNSTFVDSDVKMENQKLHAGTIGGEACLVLFQLPGKADKILVVNAYLRRQINTWPKWQRE